MKLRISVILEESDDADKWGSGESTFDFYGTTFSCNNGCAIVDYDSETQGLTVVKSELLAKDSEIAFLYSEMAFLKNKGIPT